MAIKACKECGGTVSDKAETCPNCGAKQPKKTSKLALIFAGLCLVIIFSSLLSGQNESEKPNENVRQKWFSEIDTDKMTDKKIAYVSVVANNVLMKGNDLTSIQEPIMAFRCRNNSTEILIDFKQPLSPEYGNALRRTTKFRLDDKEAFNVTLNTSQGDLRVYFVSEPVKNLKKMLGHEKLLISYQAHRSGEQILEFDIRELKDRIKPVRELCNW